MAIVWESLPWWPCAGSNPALKKGYRGALIRVEKTGFVLQIGTPFVDPSSAEPKALKSISVSGARFFLCVFSDPVAEDLRVATRALGSLEEVDGLRFVFFPQSADGEDLQAIQDRLRAIDWEVPFSFRLLNDNYTRALLGAKPDVPMALLLTPEGRVLHRAELGARGAISAFRSVARS